MALYKRSGVYWYEFVYGGRRYRKSTGVKNQRTAGDIERAFRTALAKGDVGITERKAVPGFRRAMAEFLRWSEEEHRAHYATHRRYEVSSIALLRHFGDTSLDNITPDDVERFKTSRSSEFKTTRAENGKRATQTRSCVPQR